MLFNIQTPSSVLKRKSMNDVPNSMSPDLIMIQNIEIPRKWKKATLKILVNIKASQNLIQGLN